jgi:hypothetical protein
MTAAIAPRLVRPPPERETNGIKRDLSGSAMKHPSLSIVVCGWYFKDDRLYEALQNEIEGNPDITTTLYVASHRPRSDVDPATVVRLENAHWRILWFENEGWEWMAYQQFMRHLETTGEFTDYYLFLHDDVRINEFGFIRQCVEMVKAGAKLVGNSPSAAPDKQNKTYFPEDALLIEKKWGRLKIDQWRVVRGSFFFTTQEIAREILGKMPIKRGKQIGLANGSLRIFGALVSDRYGLEAIRYLSGTPRTSEYVYEEYRGGEAKRRMRDLLPGKIKHLLKAICCGREGPAVPSGFGLKINLGCGNDPLPGYYNIDFTAPDDPSTGKIAGQDPSAMEARYFNANCADANANILEVQFDDNSLAEIMLIHVIEHMNFRDVAPLVERFRHWLKPGGQLILEFPDVIKVARFLLDMKNDPVALRESPYGLRGFYGGHASPRGHEHRWGWTGATMADLLRQQGFTQIHIERARFHNRKRDVRVRAIR